MFFLNHYPFQKETDFFVPYIFIFFYKIVSSFQFSEKAWMQMCDSPQCDIVKKKKMKKK